ENGLGIRWRIERSKRNRSVTNGSRTNEESMKAANSNPITTNARKLAINQHLRRTHPTIRPTRPVTWLSMPVREVTDRISREHYAGRVNVRPFVRLSNRCFSGLNGYKKVPGTDRDFLSRRWIC